MRESSYSFPPQNRAVLSITHMLYDRRALDTTSPLAILNNLTSLTYLTQTSPRIRDILTLDGGLERLLDILRESCMPRETYVPPDLWGLNGPPTARVIPVDRQISLRHNLAFQCVVNIGVRGSEAIRTRVVQAGSLDLVAQILESWLIQHGIAIFAGPLGSVAAVQAVAAGLPVPGVSSSKSSSETNSHPRANSGPTPRTSQAAAGHAARPQTVDSSHSGPRASDTDVDMAEADEGTDTASAGADEGMDVDGAEDVPRAGPSTTPRARQPILPMAIQIPPRLTPREVVAQASSAGNSLSGDEVGGIPRATSENNLAAAARQSLLNLSAPRMPQLAQDAVSNQSSPMGTPNRQEIAEPLRATGRRGTIVARPANLAPRNDRENESGASDVGEEVDLPAATVAAGIAAANAQAMEGGGTMLPEGAGPPPNVEIVDGATDLMEDDPDPDAMAAEQARLDMEAGAPPGQPGAAQTPRVATADTTPRQLLTQPPAAENTQIIIANGAPRGFQDLGSYVGVSAILNPDGNRYSDDSILLSLQLLAYLSKYPHVRSAFHHPRRPMHPSFEIGTDYVANPLPERPAYSQTPNVFSLVERFTFRPSPSDPGLFRIPPEIQYWAGVIMRNACRKDEAQGGIRQCANMACGRWESFAREFAKCRRCRKAKYCSKECQSKAWQEGHRFWCSTRSDELHHPAPSDVGERENPADDDDGDEHGGGHGQTGRRQPRLQFAPPLNPPPPTRGRDTTTPNNRPTASRTAQDTRVPVAANTGADTMHDIDDIQMNLLRESIGGRQTRPPGAGEPSTARTARSTGRHAEPTHRRQGGASAFLGF